MQAAKGASEGGRQELEDPITRLQKLVSYPAEFPESAGDLQAEEVHVSMHCKPVHLIWPWQALLHYWQRKLVGGDALIP